MNPGVSILIYLCVGTVGGYVGLKLKIPAGVLIGAMSAMIPLAVETQINSALVVCFHFFRVVFVLLTAPFIFKYISG